MKWPDNVKPSLLVCQSLDCNRKKGLNRTATKSEKGKRLCLPENTPAWQSPSWISTLRAHDRHIVSYTESVPRTEIWRRTSHNERRPVGPTPVHNDLKKLRIFCCSVVERRLNLRTTSFASDPGEACWLIASNKSDVLPSCRKNNL